MRHRSLVLKPLVSFNLLHLQVRDSKGQPSFLTRCHFLKRVDPNLVDFHLLVVHNTGCLARRVHFIDRMCRLQSPADYQSAQHQFRQSFLKLIMD